MKCFELLFDSKEIIGCNVSNVFTKFLCWNNESIAEQSWTLIFIDDFLILIMIFIVQFVPIGSRNSSIDDNFTFPWWIFLRRLQLSTPAIGQIHQTSFEIKISLFCLSTKFNVFTCRCTVHGQSTMVTRKRWQCQKHHQTNESKKKTWDIIGEEESNIIFVTVPTKISSKARTNQTDQTK